MERIGEKLSPLLESIEDALWEYEYHVGMKPGYTQDGFRAGVKIFMSVMIDKIWELQESESIDINDRVNMVQKCGDDIRNLIKVYTNIDTHNLYNE